MSSEPTELIYAPNASAAPIFVAAGIALLAAGVFMGWFLWLLGAAFVIIAAVAWWKTADDEISRMRREQRTDTAVIPAEPIKRG